MAHLKKLATEVKEGDTIQSPHTKSYWGIVYLIQQTAKKITFFVKFTEGDMLGKEWDYSFMKTTKVTVK